MQVKYKVQRVEAVTKEVPDHYGDDKSKRGRVVDILLDGCNREDLYSDNQQVVERAIAHLDHAYAQATRILAIFCEV